MQNINRITELLRELDLSAETLEHLKDIKDDPELFWIDLTAIEDLITCKVAELGAETVVGETGRTKEMSLMHILIFFKNFVETFIPPKKMEEMNDRRNKIINKYYKPEKKPL